MKLDNSKFEDSSVIVSILAGTEKRTNLLMFSKYFSYDNMVWDNVSYLSSEVNSKNNRSEVVLSKNNLW